MHPLSRRIDRVGQGLRSRRGACWHVRHRTESRQEEADDAEQRRRRTEAARGREPADPHALDDLAHAALTSNGDGEGCERDEEAERAWSEDTFDGTQPTDDLDEAVDLADQDPDADLDPLDVVRARIRRAELHRRRRTRRRVRPKSGVTVNVHLDLRTLSGTRDVDDLDDLVLRGEGWHVTRQAAERLLCDSALVATLFAGKNRVLDANDAAEQFNRRQRRALAARDGHCVFPSCTRPRRFCDAHHLHFRDDDGPTRVDNGALLCRFHHRLVHEYRWKLSVDDTGRWTATDRHGTTWTGRPAHPTRHNQPRAPDRPTAKTTG